MLEGHRLMIADRVRMAAYERAIGEVVRPGDVVVEIGTGTGVLACLAARAGARRVYAIEKTDVIEIARSLAAANGFADRITFLYGTSERASFPEQADVLLSETLGHFGIEEQILSIYTDARSRFLRAGGRMLPEAVTLYLGPVESPEAYDGISFWTERPLGLDWAPAVLAARNSPRYLRLPASALLGDPKVMAEFDLRKVSAGDCSGQVDCEVRRAGTFHGMAGWFCARLSPGVELGNGPADPETHWEQVFFPVRQPTAVLPQDRVRCRIMGGPAPGGFAGGMLWTWEITVLRGGAELICSRQNSLDGQSIAPEHFSLMLANRAEGLQPQGQALLRALSLMAGGISLTDLGESLCKEFPGLYPTEEAARAAAAGFAKRYANLSGADRSPL